MTLVRIFPVAGSLRRQQLTFRLKPVDGGAVRAEDQDIHAYAGAKMRAKKILERSLLTLAMASAAVSVATAQKKPQKPGVAELSLQRSRVVGEIDLLNKDKSCVGDGECETTDFGVSPCGGPEKYLVVSNANANLAKIKKLIEQYNALSEKIRALDDTIVKGCEHEAPPPVSCVDNVCGPPKNNKQGWGPIPTPIPPGTGQPVKPQ